MRTLIRPARTTKMVGALLALMAAPAVAQQPTGVLSDLLRDVSEVQEKLVGLATAMPDSSYPWRPGQGVRSVGEVFQHVAADNYLIPALLGTAPPASTGIKADNYKTVQDYETRKADRAAIIADLEQSFAHLKKTMGETPAAKLGDEVSFFGQKMTVQQAWILTTTHLHEHLGQAIAYARSNGIVPPWSRSGN